MHDSSQVPTRFPRGEASDTGTLQLSFQWLRDPLRAGQPRPGIPHRHPFHVEIVGLQSGATDCFVEGSVYRLEPGDLLLVPPGRLHSIGIAAGLTAWTLHARPDLFTADLSRVPQQVIRARATEKEAAAQLDRWRASFEYEYVRVRPGRKDAVNALLRLLGTYLERHRVAVNRQPEARGRPVSVAFRELLDTQFARERSPGAYALQLGLSTTQLHQHLIAETGAGTRQHIDRRVILEAQRMLAFTAEDTDDLALQLGFTEDGYFYHYFRKHTGLTPGAYRARHQRSSANEGAPGLELPFAEGSER